jgi:hypothetical protein
LGPDINTLKHMQKIFVDKGGEAYEFMSDKDKPVHIRFPVKLAVKLDVKFPEFFNYSDFILNLNKGEVCIKTDSPLPKGSLLIMHFYIPPEEKLLGEFKGKVVGIDRNNHIYPQGMCVKFTGNFEEDMISFVDYIEEKKHLVDIEV